LFSNVRTKIGLTFAVGVVISALAAWFVYQSNEKQQATLLANTVRVYTQAISHALNENLNRLRALQSFFVTSRTVSRDQFNSFTQGLMEGSSGIQALEWIPRVAQQKRPAFENTARFYGFTGFSFLERDSAGALSPAGVRDEYYPVYFVEPFPENQKAFGFDLASNPIRKAALIRARDTGHAVITRRITLVQETSKQYGVLVFRPVYRRDVKSDTVEGRRRAIRGFVLGVFRVGDVVRSALARVARNPNIHFKIADLNAPEDSQLLYASVFAGGEDQGQDRVVAKPAVSAPLPLPVAGNRWEISFSHHLAANRGFNGLVWFVFGVGLVITGMVSSIIAVYANRGAVTAMLVRERTAELRTSEQRARDVAVEAEAARREADIANHAKSEFLASMSHEIRTPMAGVLGLADILLEDDLTSQQRDTVKKIKGAGEALTTILNDILDLSKIQAGKIEFEHIDFDLHKLISECLDLFYRKASDKGIALGADIAPDVPTAINGDPTRIRQVLVNLLGNAVKFTEHGSVSLRATMSANEGPRATLKFEIIDTGIGIAPDRQAALFIEFTQEDASTARKYEGTGLGLAISRRLTELMGGEIGVVSAQGDGATFWFTVPARASKTDFNAEPAAAEGADFTATRPLNILLAEDNSLNQMIITAVLGKFNHLVSAVNDGRAAVEAAREGDYDLILMDVRMPEMDGMDATRMIRQGPSDSAGIPIIAVTADAVVENKAGYFEAGMNACVTKPIDQPALLQAINEVMGEEVHRRTAPAA